MVNGGSWQVVARKEKLRNACLRVIIQDAIKLLVAVWRCNERVEANSPAVVSVEYFFKSLPQSIVQVIKSKSL